MRDFIDYFLFDFLNWQWIWIVLGAWLGYDRLGEVRLG
jgi:hypothetical protein